LCGNYLPYSDICERVVSMYKRIVIKVGTKVLTDSNGGLDRTVIKHLVDQIASVRAQGCEVVLVTSGAVGSGRALMAERSRAETLADKQVYAAVGQVALMNTYAEYLAEHGLLSAQILVTKEDFRDRTHYRNMEICFHNVLREKVIPIVNENDVVAVKELIFTDNDELAGLVALQLDADAVVILTSVDGVIAGNVNDPHAQVIARIGLDDIRKAEQYVTTERSSGGRGGMRTKFAMARKLMSAGITVHFQNGRRKNGIVDALDGTLVGTTFVPDKKVSSRKRRIAHGDSLAEGAIVLNACAIEQLTQGGRVMSILPVGVVRAEGSFKKGDLVTVATERGRVVGCGIVRADADSVNRTAGVRKGRAVVHYDDLFIY